VVCFAVVAGKSARVTVWKKRFFAAGSRNPFPLWGGAHDDGTAKELTNIAKRKESIAAEGISDVQFS